LEEELRAFTDFVEFLRHYRAQMDHWFHDEGSFAHSFLPEEEASPLIELKEVENWKGWRSAPRGTVEKAFFVDGRMRIHARILFEEHALLLGELVAGYVAWEKNRGVSLGFSPKEWPPMRRILGVPQGLFGTKNIAKRVLDLGGGFVFHLEESARASREPQGIEASRQALFNALSRLEQEVTLGLLERGVPVIKDGIFHPGDTAFLFRPGVGPVGLVKRIERLPLTPEEKEFLFGLSRGERTPFLSLALEEGVLKVFSYLRLTDKDERAPWKGLVRLEVLLQRECFPGMREEVGLLFDHMAGFLPDLTDDFPWRRLPENIFPIIALEDALGQFFAAPSWIQYLCAKSLRR